MEMQNNNEMPWWATVLISVAGILGIWAFLKWIGVNLMSCLQLFFLCFVIPMIVMSLLADAIVAMLEKAFQVTVDWSISDWVTEKGLNAVNQGFERARETVENTVDNFTNQQQNQQQKKA
jgi:hypothetical protein